MANEVQAGPRKFRRTANACVACRQSKIKCSGDEPCANCQRRALKCRFLDGGNRVVVTERYLRELRQQAIEQQRSVPRTLRMVKCTIHPATPQVIDHTRSIWTSPFTLPSRTMKNIQKNKRRWIWLAPLSVWSFTARLTLMLTESLHLEGPCNTPGFLDYDVYPLEWRPAPLDVPQDISGLPSVDHALYLFQTVKFHLNSYRLFDEEAFKAAESRLWFVQFLLILAFGDAFLLRTKSPQECPGSRYFTRAMSLMPDHAYLWKDSLSAIEVLGLAGLYLYAVDHRESAHVYVAQAIRIAQLEGLHTQLPESELGSATVARCRNLWWTLYIMDRHFSSSLGLPMTTHDSDITTSFDSPTTCSQRDATLAIQVRLSHLLSSIITSVYKTEQTQLGEFLEKTRALLHTLAGHALEIENIIHTKFHNSVDTMTKATQHVTLLYHQCVMLATRPLLLSVLKERLDKLDQGEEVWQNFLTPTKPLISTGIKSAIKTLQILAIEGSILEVFLPFDLEFTFGAAIHLIMANTLFPHLAEGNPRSQQAHSLLDEMIHKGSRIAAVRKTELVHLEALFEELGTRIERRGLQVLTLSTPEDPRPVPEDSTSGNERAVSSMFNPENMPLNTTGEEESSSTPTSFPQSTNSLGLLENIGISSYEFFSILEQIGNPENYSILDPEPGWKDAA
ncbi:Zn(II)2Cys6 transcription factor [Aspergillus floccosus]